MRRIDLTNQVIDDIEVLEYIGNKQYRCRCKCGKVETKLSDSLKRRYTCKCTHIDESKSVIGKLFNEWKVVGIITESIYLCRCSCGEIRKLRKYDLENNKSKSCGHGKLTDLKGKTIGEWEVLEYVGNKKWLCKCSCGRTREIQGSTLRNKIGTSFSCGHKERTDLTGTQFTDWEVMWYTGNNKWHCKCSCGTESDVSEYSLLGGTSKSCGHSKAFIDLSGKHIGELDVIKYIGHQTFLCKCSCGKLIEKPSRFLRRSENPSCGHINQYLTAINKNKNRDIWQIEAALSKEKLANVIGDSKPSPLDVADMLGISYPHAVKLINKYGLGDLISKSNNYYMENEIVDYIRELVGDNVEIQLKNRSILDGKELDIYIPSLKIAVEFNGTYWHSDLYKDTKYHQLKTIKCAQRGIRLIHIFEYEWLDKLKRIKIEKYLRDILSDKTVIYARKTEIKIVSNSVAGKFLDENHLQGAAKASINIGLYNNSELIGLMTFGKPRFNSEYEYEVIRLCYKYGVTVAGGTEKMFKHFLHNYNPTSIITYTDLAKFIGLGYIRIGFRPIENNYLSKPNYRWVNLKTQENLSRYQTQKSKLVACGFGTDDDTEQNIMEELGYVRVYDSGNYKYEWIKDNSN